jgi:hypothetical protein
MIGSVEALQAANALGTEEFQKYFDTFIDGVDGATAAARELQRADVSYQLKADAIPVPSGGPKHCRGRPCQPLISFCRLSTTHLKISTGKRSARAG